MRPGKPASLPRAERRPEPPTRWEDCFALARNRAAVSTLAVKRRTTASFSEISIHSPDDDPPPSANSFRLTFLPFRIRVFRLKPGRT